MAKKKVPTPKRTRAFEYFIIESKSTKTTSFSPADLQADDMGNQVVVTIQGMLPKANPTMLKSVFTCISRAEKEALFKESSFLDMHKKGIYDVKPIAFKNMPTEYQLKYNRKQYNQLQTKQKKAEED